VAAPPSINCRGGCSSDRAAEPPPAICAAHSVLSDWERKRRGLRKIQRLASSGLPLLPFAYTLFDISTEAIDQLDFHRIGERFGVWLCKTLTLPNGAASIGKL
jgi:hypothetical protein